jgi:hypothetical protein
MRSCALSPFPALPAGDTLVVAVIEKLRDEGTLEWHYMLPQTSEPVFKLVQEAFEATVLIDIALEE